MYVKVTYEPAFDTYKRIWFKNASYILEYSSSFPSFIATNFEINFTLLSS